MLTLAVNNLGITANNFYQTGGSKYATIDTF